MHDLMHDLACSISENECIHGLRNDIAERTCHLSLDSMSCYKSKNNRETLSKARNLRTLFVIRSVYCRKLDYNQFLQGLLRLRMLDMSLSSRDKKTKLFKSIIGRFKHLRYLSLWFGDFKVLPNCITELYNLETLFLKFWKRLEKLPGDIKKLINLKHFSLQGNASLGLLPNSVTELCKLETLDLYDCGNLKGLPTDVENWTNLRHLILTGTGIKFLPDSITQLNNLEVLFLGSSNLKELPNDIKKLINLKHLCMTYGGALTHMPKGIGELTNLQTLHEFVLGDKNGGELSELNELNKLNGCLKIKNLQFCSDGDLPRKAKFLQLKSGLHGLKLEWKNSFIDPTNDNLDNVEERVLDCLQPHSNLQKILIYGYGGVKLCNWLSSCSLGCLVAIRLVSCKRLQRLPQFDRFPYLKSLFLDDLPNVEYAGNDDSVSSATFFPSLEELSIINMPKLTRWWNGSFSIIFPSLSQLEISGCSLYILKSWHAPLLEALKIGGSAKGHDVEDDELDVVPWKNFENLSYLKLFEFSKLECLPNSLQHVTTLQDLILLGCTNLKCLPEWIRDIHSLQVLELMRCPILIERCKKDKGEDWPKVAHIREVVLSYFVQYGLNQEHPPLFRPRRVFNPIIGDDF